MLIWNYSAFWYLPVGIHDKSFGMRDLWSCDEAKGDDCFGNHFYRPQQRACFCVLQPSSSSQCSDSLTLRKLVLVAGTNQFSR